MVGFVLLVKIRKLSNNESVENGKDSIIRKDNRVSWNIIYQLDN